MGRVKDGNDEGPNLNWVALNEKQLYEVELTWEGKGRVVLSLK